MTNLSVIFNAVDNISGKLSQIGSQMGSMSDSFQNAERGADAAFDAVANGANESERAIQEFASNFADGFIDSFRQAAQEAGASEDEIEAAFRELPDMFRGIADGMEEGIDGVSDGANRAGDDVEALGDEFQRTGEKGKGSGENMQEALQSVESMLAASGIMRGLKSIAGAFADCAAQAEMVETAFAKLETIAGSSPMENLKGQIMSLSSETGIAAADLADVAYNAISAGTAVEDSVTMAATASKLATAGFTDTGSALSTLTTALNAYGDSAGTATDIADSLITVQNLGVTTVAELSANMGKAIATASAYNVNLSNLEASYISVTKAGINTAEGTTYVSSMLKELGTAGSDVANILEEETGQSFGQLMDSGASLADVLGILYESAGQDKEALMNLWGSAEAGKAASAIVGQGLEEFNDNLVKLGESAGATEKAYATMADTTEFAHNKMKNSFDNMKVSVGNALNPMMEGFYNIGAAFADTIAGIADKAPWLVNLITSIVSGLGAGIAVISGVVVVTKLWTVANAALTASLGAANTAMTLQVAAITAVVVAAGMLIAAIVSASDEEEVMTASTARMQEELDETSSQYERACAVMGENSDAARTLRAEMDYLNDEIENNGMTLEEYYSKVDKLCEESANTVSAFRDTQEEIDRNKVAADNLVGKLRDLADNTDSATNKQGEMEAIIKRLNTIYPELGLKIEDVTDGLGGLEQKINAVNSASKLQERDAAVEALGKATEEYDQLVQRRKELNEELIRANEAYADQGFLEGLYNEKTGRGASKQLEDAQTELAKVEAQIESTGKTMDEAREIVESFDGAMYGTSEETINLYDAMSMAAEAHSEKIEALAEEYQKAYDAAITSIQGQYQLWEQADEVATASIEDMNQAMESQIEYWNNYAENLDNLTSRNVEGLDALVASMDDGSADSAAYLAAMASASDEELAEMVKNFEQLQDSQAKTADTMAELETDFQNRLSDIESDFQETVANMNMESEARAAAEATMSAYIAGIKSMENDAVTAMSNVTSRVASAMHYTPGGSTEGNASGTTDASPVYFAGEKGPELILSGGHDVVFPTNETNKIINAVNNYNNTQLTDESGRSSDDYMTVGSGNANSSKTITLDIKGSGSIKVDGNMDKEAIWNNMEETIKNAMMSIISQEIFEGSEMAYGY